jgi:hypothetical protein
MLAWSLSGSVTLLAQTQAAAAKPPAEPAPAAPSVSQPSAQTASPVPALSTTAPTADQPATPLPVNVDQIQRQLQQQPAVKLDDQQLRFYVLVLGKEPPKFFDFIGDYDLKNGPTKGGAAMTHQEFLNMVTPKELNELFGSTSSSSFAMFQAAVMNAAAQSLIKKGLEEIRHARNEREVQAIRERIDRELSALLGKEQ